MFCQTSTFDSFYNYILLVFSLITHGLTNMRLHDCRTYSWLSRHCFVFLSPAFVLPLTHFSLFPTSGTLWNIFSKVHELMRTNMYISAGASAFDLSLKLAAIVWRFCVSLVYMRRYVRKTRISIIKTIMPRMSTGNITVLAQQVHKRYSFSVQSKISTLSSFISEIGLTDGSLVIVKDATAPICESKTMILHTRIIVGISYIRAICFSQMLAGFARE